MLGAMSLGHWVIVILVITLLFGRGRISGLMDDLGKSVKQLRNINKDDIDVK